MGKERAAARVSLPLVLALLLGGCFLHTSRQEAGVGLPRVLRYDTRSLTYFVIRDSLSSALARFYEEAQADTLEDAACLYGEMRADTLIINGMRPASIAFRYPHQVMFSGLGGYQGCFEERRFVGAVHTHLRTAEDVAQVAPSPMDFVTFWSDQRALIMVVLSEVAYTVEEGRLLRAFWVMRDGRWGASMWRAP